MEDSGRRTQLWRRPSHVAFWSRYVADCLNGKQANDTLNELPITEYPT
jgi:hypothetical protein